MTSTLRPGFLTLAIGDRRYARQAQTLSLSLRRNMPGYQIAIVTDRDDLAPFADVLVPVDRSAPIATAQKLLLWKYSPFERTLFIDSDCVATRAFHMELEEIGARSFSPVVDRYVPAQGDDEYIEDLAAALRMVGGDVFPKFNGGVYFFDRSKLAREVFEFAWEIYRDYRAYGIRAFDRGGAGDETVIGLSLAHLGLLDLYDDAGRLMRTPTGLRGSLTIDPIGGGCVFTRAEGVVRPAICHFAGPYLHMPEYRLAEMALRRGVGVRELGLGARLSAVAASAFARTSRYIEYKKHGFEKRFRAIRYG